MSGWRFRPTALHSGLAAVGIAGTIALGFWQLDRARQKTELVELRQAARSQPPLQVGESELDAAAVEQRLVEAKGRFQVAGAVWLDNRVRDGQAGYELVMPLKLGDGSRHVLVNRGWVRGSGDRSRLPEVATPAHEVQVVGIAVVPGRRVYELGSGAIEGKVWQNLTLERYRSHTGYAVQPFMILQTNDLGDGLVRAWPSADRRIDVHRSYAVQWFALAAAIAAAYLYFSLHRARADR